MQGVVHLQLAVLLVCCSLMGVQSAGTCDSLLLSLSTAGICEDGVCRAQESAQIQTFLGKGHSFCFRIDESQFGGHEKSINFTVVDSWVSYPVRDCYMSDDPLANFVGYCSCPLSGLVSCNDCPALASNISDTFCIEGLNRGSGCFGFAAATHCVAGSLQGGNRYKVCSIGEPKVEVFYSFYDSVTYTHGYQDITKNRWVFSNQANISFYDIKGLKDHTNRMLILDTLNPSNIYLAPASDVNTRLTRDPNKLGWFRPNGTDYHQLAKFVTVDVNRCSDDEFSIGFGPAYFRESINAHPEWPLLNNIKGAVWVDEDTETSQVPMPIYDPPLPTLSEGAIFRTVDGTLVPFGMDENRVSVNYGHQVYTPTGGILLSNGTNIPTVGRCGDWYQVSTGMEDVGGTTFKQLTEIRQCTQHDIYDVWAICYRKSWWGIPPLPTRLESCTNIGFAATKWPSNEDGFWALRITQNVTGPPFFGGSMMQFYSTVDVKSGFNTSSDHLVIANQKVETQAVVQFLNISVEFAVTNVFPKINRIDHDDDELTVWAESTSVKGSCLLMVSDDVAPTKLIELSLVENKYSLPFMIGKFKGDVVVSIQCYKNTDSVKFFMEVEKGDVDIRYKSINSTSVRRVSKDENVWDKTKKGAKKVGNWFTDWTAAVWNVTGNSVADFCLGILFSFLIILGSLAVGAFVILWSIRLIPRFVKWVAGTVRTRYQRFRNRSKGYTNRGLVIGKSA